MLIKAMEITIENPIYLTKVKLSIDILRSFEAKMIDEKEVSVDKGKKDVGSFDFHRNKRSRSKRYLILLSPVTATRQGTLRYEYNCYGASRATSS